MKRSGTARRRNAAATREDILASAFHAFARAGYDGVGVREIAGDAGVTAMLVNRYFGSKEKLFAEVVARAMTRPSVMSADRIGAADAAEAIASALVASTKPGAPPLDGMRIILNSASNPRAAEIIREQMEDYHYAMVESAIGAGNAGERATLVLALVAGFQFMRQTIRLRSLTDADEELLIRLVAGMLRHAMGRTSAMPGVTTKS